MHDLRGKVRENTKVKIILVHIGVAALLSLLIVLFWSDIASCPIYTIFKIPCPCCRMVHAIKCLVTLDLSGYVKYNVMAVPVMLAVIIIIHAKNVPYLALRRALIGIAITVFAVNLVYYLVRLFNGSLEALF